MSVVERVDGKAVERTQAINIRIAELKARIEGKASAIIPLHSRGEIISDQEALVVLEQVREHTLTYGDSLKVGNYIYRPVPSFARREIDALLGRQRKALTLFDTAIHIFKSFYGNDPDVRRNPFYKAETSHISSSRENLGYVVSENKDMVSCK